MKTLRTRIRLTNWTQKLPVTMTLATLRAHVWKGGADVMLYYKSNGRKNLELHQEKSAEPVDEAENAAAPPIPIMSEGTAV